MAIAITAMKREKAAEPSDLFTDMIIYASGKVGISVMMELCQRVLNGNQIPGKRQASVLAPIF